MFYIRSIPTSVWHVVILLVTCGILYFPNLGTIPFYDKGEPREALVVQEIVYQGEWLLPLKRGDAIPSKPPLFHWFGAFVSLARGQVTEATVRLPSALFATLGVLLLYLLGRRIFDPSVAFLGAVILATSFLYQKQAVEARVDMTLTFFMSLTLALFYLVYQGLVTRPVWTYVFFLLLGVSVLAKGPVGAVLPAIIVGAFLGARKRWKFLSRLCFHKGVILTLLVAVSWYGIALGIGGEDFFRRQILQENLQRFFVYGEGGTGHQKPFYYYVPYLFLAGLPWSVFLPFLFLDYFKGRAFAADHSLYLILWAGLILLFFSLSSGKRWVYLLPLYPALSLLIAQWLTQPAHWERMANLGLQSVGWLFLLIGFALVGLFVWVAMGKDLFSLLPHFGVMLKPSEQARLSVVREALARSGWLFHFFLLFSAFLWLAAAHRLFVREAWAAAVPLVCLTVLTALFVQGSVVSSIAAARSYKPFMVAVNELVTRDGPLWIYGEGWD
ncbi:MAG: glycosyltransferase family 39 protein, partial [Deltaproteobacteria bacterium]|nr:glycosyltransferase family 39 protein [Deltaproteobacteria bacterium]